MMSNTPFSRDVGKRVDDMRRRRGVLGSCCCCCCCCRLEEEEEVVVVIFSCSSSAFSCGFLVLERRVRERMVWRGEEGGLPGIWFLLISFLFLSFCVLLAMEDGFCY